MNKADIQQTGGFPLETDTLDFMQEAYSFLNNLGYLGGNSIIVRGCLENGNNVGNGVVFFNGELFEFRGGLKGTHVRIVTEQETRAFENGQIKVIYEKRHATFGSPGVPWQAFQRPRDLWNLTLQQDQIKPKVVPIGAIVMWAGAINQIPTGWKLCDGQNGTPDLRARFIVGYDDRDADYNAVGKIGGAKTVALSESQMPKHKHNVGLGGEHSHEYNDSYYIENLAGISASRVPGTVLEVLPGNYVGSAKTDSDNNRILYRKRQTGNSPQHDHTVSETGGGAAHENRPPYYTLAFIQFKG